MSRALKIIFMGTPDFAVPSLQILVENGYDIVGVITSTDKLGGRGKKQLLQSAVKKYAISKGLHILQPKNLKSKKFIAKLQALNANLQIVIAFRMLPEIVWNMPEYGTYNLHGSLLPKFRGAAPINWAIISGEKETGVTSFKLKHEIDTGDLLLSKKISIEHEDTAGTLHDKMMVLAADTILETVRLIENDEASLHPQDDSLVSKAPKIFHEDCQIDFNQDASTVYNFIRGLSPYPASWTTFRNLKLKIYKSQLHIGSHTEVPGTIETDTKQMKIYCTDGYLKITEVQWEGRRKMEIQGFLNGLK